MTPNGNINTFLKKTIERDSFPDFIVIGAQKGGTSSLFSYLQQHSSLQLPDSKELHFFDKNYNKGITWYKDQFPKIEIDVLMKTGEASPYYLFHPHAPQRVYEHLPFVKLIVMLRNPVDRAYSHYMMQKTRGLEVLQTFEEAIGAEDNRVKGETRKMMADQQYISYNHQKLSYLSRGLYYEQINTWLKFFPMKQFLFIKSEDFFDDPINELYRVHSFLGIKKEDPLSLAPVNTQSYPPMIISTRLKLTSYFVDANIKLATLIGDHFSWDK